MTTLVEELEQAADDTDENAAQYAREGAEQMRARAARLRLRADAVRRWYGEHDKCDPWLCSRVNVAGPDLASPPTDSPAEPGPEKLFCPLCDDEINQDALITGCRVVTVAGQRAVRCAKTGDTTKSSPTRRPAEPGRELGPLTCVHGRPGGALCPHCGTTPEASSPALTVACGTCARCRGRGRVPCEEPVDICDNASCARCPSCNPGAAQTHRGEGTR